MDERLFGTDFELYKNSLNVFLERNIIINSNIANVDTPGYKAKDLRFEEYLKSIVEGEKYNRIKLATTSERHIQISPYPIPHPKVYYETTSFGEDGNSVDIDNEMMKLSENALRYRISSEFISGKFNSIKNTIERMRP
ncbi:MAG: flagellar basal body rod protein FlgB [bacterium]|nr:flagellar basal body rod protein FlgB [bacterium]MDW8086914.1 flagellar basal body rod protein FlgB [Candidatus Calescibacterium sp.]